MLHDLFCGSRINFGRKAERNLGQTLLAAAHGLDEDPPDSEVYRSSLHDHFALVRVMYWVTARLQQRRIPILKTPEKSQNYGEVQELPHNHCVTV